MAREKSPSYFLKEVTGIASSTPELSNNSFWNNFKLIDNEDWSYHNVVLLGDALHSVHFSIGSGTCRVPEGAIALHKTLAMHKDTSATLK